MAEPISIQQLKDASLDVKSLEEVVNGNENVVVTTRLGETYPSVKGSIKKVFESGGLPATPFATKALMTASALVDGKYAQVTDDTVNNGLYVKTAGVWVKSAYDPLANSKSYTDQKRALGENLVGFAFFYDPYYEITTSELYGVLALYVKFVSGGSGGDRIGYVMDKRISSTPLYMLKSDFEVMLASQGKVLVTSPKGVENCLKLINKETLVFDLTTNKLNIVASESAGNYIRMAGMDYGRINKAVEEPVIFHQDALQKINETKTLLNNRIDSISTASYTAPSKNIKGIAHRGYSSVAPENTLPSYTLAKKKGFQYFEADVRFTSDNVPVLLHDATINRTSNGTGNIADMTLATAKTYDFGGWKGAQYAGTKIPTLKEFLDLCRILGAHAYLETKDLTVTQVNAVMQAVKDAQMNEDVSYISFQLASLEVIKTADPKARLGWVTDTYYEARIDSVVALRTGQNEVFIDWYGAGGFDPNIKALMPYAIANDVPVEVWTINTAALAMTFIEMGVTGITTDLIIVEDEISKKYLV